MLSFIAHNSCNVVSIIFIDPHQFNRRGYFRADKPIVLADSAYHGFLLRVVDMPTIPSQQIIHAMDCG